MHKQISKQAIQILSKFDEVSKIVLYGSVLRGDYRTDSDIDLAVICDDLWKELPLDSEGIPLGLRTRMDKQLNIIRDKTGIIFHIPIYWNSEFERGIELDSGKKSPPDLLHKVGFVVYDAERELN
jgi:predicted nucleotidyltransferase